ncbi:sodium- and chloride-dependent neutral and basic amino acid transporter B(0+)-like isoform X3 [Anneissia japonica]|uniref:sodium- and chloride-dependent neutral and basic amino acid transporter B(0+)-like isoform X2 n=1 Tax=Anneissia japonica TaxID=1529436 RepID=UPI0014255111|nr:sodium- and chloride-dependent neutral and basic amino acid transporter B(0+)-like isoform X2 [Anneissia japonica]XP_033119229.1 sodium- and chloride-dependent neutral and basic amino acid transporter B(0+)-like isoform X3 [Anneissia japonica]
MEKEKGTISTTDLVKSGVDESEDRGKWGSKADFLLSCLGYAVGLGNVWRFPYLCYENGGGAFLIPYAIMLVFAGLPVFFMEVSLGQYSSSGPATAWKISPMFRGIGYGMILVSALVGIYYNVIIMYALYYMFASMRKTLPWTNCDNTWNTDNCYGRYTDCIDLGDSIINDTNGCVNVSMLTQNQREHYNVTYDSNTGTANVSGYTDPFASQRVLASEEYYRNKVLRESDGIGELGGVVWHLFGCLIGAWVIVFLCLVRGIKSSGKVVYFTATFPYVVLLILLVRGLTLEGHEKGIEFFITPNWDKLWEAKVWKDAAIQIFYSLSAAWGGLLTLSSYNKFHNNCYFDAIFVSIANCCTSIFAGFVIFSILGYMAHELDREVDEVVDQGFSLAFIAYPEALARMPAAPLWAILFFAMLVTLGLDSQFTILETVVTSITDTFPGLRKRKTLVLLVSCVTMFCISIICVTEAGIYWVNLLDSYSASFALLTFAMTECLVISWIYGVARFRNDIRTMIGDSWVDFPLFNYWIAAWAVLTPGLLLVRIISILKNPYTYPSSFYIM